MEYKNKARPNSNGTQKEVPKITITGEQCTISGYQNFTITKNSLSNIKNYTGKFNFITEFLANNIDKYDSVTDIGTSNGLVAFTAALIGYKNVYALDHDLDCLKLISKVKKHLQFNNIEERKYSFGDPHVKTDLIIVLALIHWIFSCTGLYGSFDKINEYLKSIVNKCLLIEWVDPEDPAIKMFKHISFNKEHISEKYCKENFLKSLHKYFSKVVLVHKVNSTRELYLCWF